MSQGMWAFSKIRRDNETSFCLEAPESSVALITIYFGPMEPVSRF